jgi:hypothetical protein
VPSLLDLAYFKGGVAFHSQVLSLCPPSLFVKKGPQIKGWRTNCKEAKVRPVKETLKLRSDFAKIVRASLRQANVKVR